MVDLMNGAGVPLAAVGHLVFQPCERRRRVCGDQRNEVHYRPGGQPSIVAVSDGARVAFDLGICRIHM